LIKGFCLIASRFWLLLAERIDGFSDGSFRSVEQPKQKDRQMEFIVLTVFSITLACSTEVACLPAGGVDWDLTAQSQGLSSIR
jgi:hypothetical protein